MTQTRHLFRHRIERRAGFTLMEVLLVLLILGVIAAMVVPQMLGHAKHANVQATQGSIKSLENALDIYNLHMGDYPSTAEGLVALLNSPNNDTKWRGPYLQNSSKLPVDAWGQPFQYSWPGQNNRDKPDIWSPGADKQDGTADDVTNWLPPN